MRKRIFFYTFLALAFFASEAKAAKLPVTVKAHVDADSVNIGTDIRYAIEVSSRESTQIEFPVFTGDIGGLAIKDAGSTGKRFLGNKTVTQWYILNTYKPGKYTIPEAVVRYKEEKGTTWREIRMEPIGIEVKSVLARYPGAKDIRDIKGPLYLRPIYPLVLLVILVAGAVIFLGLLIYRKRKSLKERFLQPRIKLPYEIAYERLEELKKKDLIRQGRVREYYFELSDIARRYLEDRFNLRAPEMTTEEFLTSLKVDDRLGKEEKVLLKEFLSHCDLVKFAKYGPSEKDIETSYGSAKSLIDKTRENTAKEKKDDFSESVGAAGASAGARRDLLRRK